MAGDGLLVYPGKCMWPEVSMATKLVKLYLMH